MLLRGVPLMEEKEPATKILPSACSATARLPKPPAVLAVLKPESGVPLLLTRRTETCWARTTFPSDWSASARSGWKDDEEEEKVASSVPSHFESTCAHSRSSNQDLAIGLYGDGSDVTRGGCCSKETSVDATIDVETYDPPSGNIVEGAELASN